MNTPLLAPPRPNEVLKSRMPWATILAASAVCGMAYAYSVFTRAPRIAAHLDWPTTVGLQLTLLLFAWVLFLQRDLKRHPHRLSLGRRLGLFGHVVPGLAVAGSGIAAQSAADYYTVWLAFLLVLRYWRTAVQIFFWARYAPALASGADVFSAADCTAVCATVGPEGNTVFDCVVAAVLWNRPARVVFACNTAAAAEAVGGFLESFRGEFEAGATRYQREHGLAGFAVGEHTQIRVVCVGVSNKRRQMVAGLAHVETAVMVSVDDTAIWAPEWLAGSLPAFNDARVGLVGTRKWVQRLPRHHDASASAVTNLWNAYVSGFWNAMGGVYLIRHNFELRSTNAADGGVFCVSARSNLIRSAIVKHAAFAEAFTNEYVLPLGTHFRGFGPLNADDDNFVTRHVLRAGWEIKAQCAEATTMTTTIGAWPAGFKFPSQCVRWSRSTFRQNPLALFVDRSVWSRWPLTTWLTYLPWLYNAALLWDALAVYVLLQTDLYAASAHPRLLLLALVYVFQLAKLVKTHEWWVAHPADFVLYYLIPAYPLFTYWHSLLKLYTALTFWNTEWSGRPTLGVEADGESNGESTPQKQV